MVNSFQVQVEREQSLSYNPPVWGSGFAFPWPHPVPPNLPLPPTPPHHLVSLCSFPPPQFPSWPLPTLLILCPYPTLPPTYLLTSQPCPSPPAPFLSRSSQWDGWCTRRRSSESVTGRRPQLPWLLFFYTLSPDPTQGSTGGSGRTWAPNTVFLLFTCHEFEERAPPQTCDGSVSTCLSKNGTQTHRGGFAP